MAASKTALPPIVCADISADALDGRAPERIGRRCRRRADVRARRRATLEKRWPAGTVVTNPPYGERLKPDALGALYRAMARAFGRLGGWRVSVLSGSPLWTREMGQKAVISHKLFNGPLEVRLLCYDVK